MEGIRRGPEGFTYGEGPQGPLAVIDFHREADGTILVEHTGVDPSLKGQGVGARLVAEVVALARAEGVGIRSRCSFATKVLSDDPATAGLLRGD